MASTITLQRTINLAQQFIRQAPLVFSALGTVSVGNNAGTGYALGDSVYIPGGLGGVATVISIGAGGLVSGLLLKTAGQGYFSALTNSVTTTSGSGINLTVNTTTTYYDPAFSNADWVKQMILSPPFAWRWNRATGGSPASPTFQTIIGRTDYSVSLPNFGWMEKAVGYDPAAGYKSFELQVQLIKAIETKPNQPTRIAVQFDDGAGNITFRLFPAPDKIYNIVVESQNSASQFTSLTQTWAPIPDYLSYIVNEGFQAKAYEYSNDPRVTMAMQLFIQDLAANAEGLELSEKNIWAEDRLNSIRQAQAVQAGKV